MLHRGSLSVARRWLGQGRGSTKQTTPSRRRGRGAALHRAGLTDRRQPASTSFAPWLTACGQVAVVSESLVLCVDTGCAARALTATIVGRPERSRVQTGKTGQWDARTNTGCGGWRRRRRIRGLGRGSGATNGRRRGRACRHGGRSRVDVSRWVWRRCCGATGRGLWPLLLSFTFSLTFTFDFTQSFALPLFSHIVAEWICRCTAVAAAYSTTTAAAASEKRRST